MKNGLQLTVLLLLFYVNSFAETLDFSQQASMLDTLRLAILPIITGLATLALVIAGIMYMTGKGNVAKEHLINIMYGAILIGGSSGIAALILNFS